MSVDAVMMVLQLLLRCIRRPASSSRPGGLTRHGGGRRTETERESESFTHDSPETPAERDVNDEVS